MEARRPSANGRVLPAARGKMILSGRPSSDVVERPFVLRRSTASSVSHDYFARRSPVRRTTIKKLPPPV